MKSTKIQKPLDKNSFSYEIKKNYVLYLFMLPAVAFFICFSYMPMFGVLIAFKEVDYSLGILRSPWIGLKNFTYLFSTPDALLITRNTILYNLAFIIIGTTFTIFVSLLINEITKSFAKKVCQGILFLPHFISWVIAGYMFYVFLSPQYGYLNKNILEPLGIGDIQWYTTTKYWPYILVLAHMWKNTGYGTIVYLAGMTAIDSDLYEAAVIDGATKLQQAMHVTLPCLKPTIVVNMIMALGAIFSTDFGLFYFTTRNSAALYPVTQVIGMYTYRALRELGDLGMSSAASLYQAAVGFVLVAFSNHIVKKVNSDMSLY